MVRKTRQSRGRIIKLPELQFVLLLINDLHRYWLNLTPSFLIFIDWKGIHMKTHWWKSLRIKIIGWSFVPTVIILSAVAWFTFYSYQKVIGDLAIKQDWGIVQSKTPPLFQAFFDITNPLIVKIILQVDTQRGAPLEDRAQNIIDHAEGIDIFDGGIYFVDAQGKVVKTYPDQPEVLGQDWSDAQFRYMVDHPGKAAYNNLRTIEPSGKEILCISASMNGSQGEFIGADYYCFTIFPATQNTFYESFSNAYSKNALDANIYIVDGNQHIIFSTDPSEMGKDLSGEAYIQQLLQGQSMSGRFRKGAEDLLVSYAPFYPYAGNYVQWNVIKEESWSEIMRPTLPYRYLLYGLLALGVIVPMLVTAYGVRHITNPIQELIHASEQVTAGDFKHRIEVNTGDEIETLADQFNTMSAELDDSYSSLEKKVTARTKELATLNAIAVQVSSSLNLNEIMSDALDRIMDLTGMEYGIAYRVESGDDRAVNNGTEVEKAYLRVMALRGMPSTYADLGEKLPLKHSAAGVAGRRGEPVIWTLEELPTDGTVKQRLVTLGVEQVIAIPLMAKGRFVGSLNLSTNQSRTYPPEQIALLKTVGQQIGVAVENARLYEQAEQAAITAERSRLARELHDAVTQTLFSANLIADVLPRIWKRDPEEGMKNLEELRQLTRGALAEMRTMLLEMRPESLERADIRTLLTQLADAFIGRVRVPVALDIQGDCKLTHEVKLVFYRVAQEAMNNIAKHAGARQVSMRLECQPGQLNLLIKDDGLGFDPGAITAEHLG
ncbi:MAG: HAMP domain-containing protein, partial [Anaerolineae bacterium]|nr:HAMP domain-containing protein [Anaerolineae bacterium]